MKAAVLHAPNQPLTIEDVALTKPQAREVLLRTAFAGLCHSDLHFIDGLYPHPTPCVLGHESAGVVEAVGEDVTYVKPGDHVITCLSVFCGECAQCVTGHPNLCENTEVKLLPGAARRLTWKGQVLNQAFNLSAFAEFMLVHEHAVVKVRTGGGVPYSFEAIGTKTTAEQSFQMLRPGGVATIIGMIPLGTKIELHGADFLRDRRIQGTSMGGNRFRVDMPRLLELYVQGKLKLDHMISG